LKQIAQKVVKEFHGNLPTSIETLMTFPGVGRANVMDAEILTLVERTLDTSNPREWYYALMDYGVMLKTKYENPNRRSAHYQKQSPFQGSNRQIRGMILKLLVQESYVSEHDIVSKLNIHGENLKNNLAQLVKEGFIKKVRGKFTVA